MGSCVLGRVQYSRENVLAGRYVFSQFLETSADIQMIPTGRYATRADHTEIALTSRRSTCITGKQTIWNGMNPVA